MYIGGYDDFDDENDEDGKIGNGITSKEFPWVQSHVSGVHSGQLGTNFIAGQWSSLYTL